MTQCPPRIIGLSGKIASGKTWVAKLLSNTYDGHRESFAGALKSDVIDMGFAPDDVYLYKPPHIRDLLQSYGAAWRAEDPDHWVTRTFQYINMVWAADPNTVIIIDDVRYPNEARAIMEAGGVVIRLEVLGEDPASDHHSETALDDFPDFLGVVRVERGDLRGLALGVMEVLNCKDDSCS